MCNKNKNKHEERGSSSKYISASEYRALHNANLYLYPPLKFYPPGPQSLII